MARTQRQRRARCQINWPAVAAALGGLAAVIQALTGCAAAVWNRM